MRDDIMGDVFVDIGKSGMRLEAFTSTGTVRVEGLGISPTQSGDRGRLLGHGITALLAEVPSLVAERILIGSTSDMTGEESTSLLRLLRAAAPRAVIGLTDDGTLAHARRLNAPGVLIAVGTGVIGIARSALGLVSRIDGWGPIAGDRGAATDVGRLALRAAYQAVDQRLESPMRTAVERRIGPANLATACAMLADETWPATLAQLAEDVCTEAEGGDPEAGRILDSAVAELGQTIGYAVSAAGVRDVLIVGRFGTATPVYARLATLSATMGFRLVEGLPQGSVGAEEILNGPYSIDIDHPSSSRKRQ